MITTFANILIISVIVCQLIDRIFAQSLTNNLNPLWLGIFPVLLGVSFVQKGYREGIHWKQKISWKKGLPVYLACLFVLSIYGRAWVQGHLDYSLITSHQLCFLLFLLGVTVWKKEDNILEIITFIVILLVFIESILGIVEGIIWPRQFFWAGNSYYYNDGIRFDRDILRISGTLLNPGYYGAFLSMGLPLILSFLFSTRKPAMRWFSAITLITCLVAILYSYTRDSYLLAFITLMITVYLLYRKKIVLVPQVKRILYGMGIILVILVLGSPAILKRGASLINREDHSLQSRIVLLSESMDIIRDYPLTGVGVNQFSPVYSYIYHDSVTHVNSIYPHNNFLEYWINWGLIPLIFYISLLYAILQPAILQIIKVSNKEDKTLLTGWVGVLLVFTIAGLTEETVLFSVLNTISWIGMAILWIGCWDEKSLV